jgi:hypothetical protein
VLRRIDRDLDRRMYDYINRVLVTLPLSDLQGYEDDLPYRRMHLHRLILGETYNFF